MGNTEREMMLRIQEQRLEIAKLEALSALEYIWDLRWLAARTRSLENNGHNSCALDVLGEFRNPSTTDRQCLPDITIIRIARFQPADGDGPGWMEEIALR